MRKSRSHASMLMFVASPMAPPTPTLRVSVSSFGTYEKVQRTNIHENVKTSVKFYCLRDSILTRLLVRHVGLNHFRYTPFLIDHSLRLLGPFDIEVDESNFGSMAGKKNCSGTSVSNFAFDLSIISFSREHRGSSEKLTVHTGAGACHDRNIAGEVKGSGRGHCVDSVWSIRCRLIGLVKGCKKHSGRICPR